MKKTRILLIVCIVMLVFSTISLVIYLIYQNKRVEAEYVMEQPAEQALEGKLYPNNFTEFYFNYGGTISTNDIYSKLHDIVINGIPKLNSDVSKLNSDEDISNYYKKQDYVKRNLCIGSEEQLKIMVELLKQLNKSNLKYSICEVEKSSTIVFSNRTEFRLSIKYENCDAISIKVVVYNAKKDNTIINIIPIIEE